MNKRKISLITALVFIAVLAFGGQAVSAQSSNTVQGINPDSLTCNRMTIKRATNIFRRLDGTKSRAKNWHLNPHGTSGIRYAGPRLVGVVPQGFEVIDTWGEHISRWNPVSHGFEGYKIEFDESEVWCIPDPKTDHLQTPISQCPRSVDEAWRMFGGAKKFWTSWGFDPEVDESWTFYYNWNVNRKAPKVAFYVPFQAEVIDWVNADGAQVKYGPGYRMRQSRNFVLKCYNAHGQMPAGS